MWTAPSRYKRPLSIKHSYSSLSRRGINTALCVVVLVRHQENLGESPAKLLMASSLLNYVELLGSQLCVPTSADCGKKLMVSPLDKLFWHPVKQKIEEKWKELKSPSV